MEIDWREPLLKWGLEIPKTEEFADVPENIQKDADRIFNVFAAYKRAGFTYEEALELTRAKVGGEAGHFTE